MLGLRSSRDISGTAPVDTNHNGSFEESAMSWYGFSLEVTYTVSPTAAIALDRSSLTPSCQQSQNATRDTFQVWNSGTGTLSYTIYDDANWLSVSPAEV